MNVRLKVNRKGLSNYLAGRRFEQQFKKPGYLQH